ncbi:NUDIX hydrolase [Peptoniphilus sp. oral taxon 386]|uniref:NUDIX hydrolase n=1 Tax=Peptoniphilus sp. oral taxon 386 TaxID=652713 RepID=UPI0001DA9AF1|nr:NUDIX hydrolase [Peptoniphilus sp. oral taxon 386]EFI42059.1 nudix-type nucleoside diphosphatase, YffH/AdpP family [Peptoniphilus sp. oral taxon 386 str. F0131]
MDKTERTMKTDRIYDGKILSLRVETVELPDKKYSKREIIEHPPAVVIVPVTSNNEIIMIKQFRKPIEKVIYEVPAGLLEINESPIDGAIRELKEETGYHADKVEYMTEFYSSPGFCTEKMYIFSAENLEFEEQKLDEDEFIDLEIVPFDRALKMIKLGEIMDAKTIAGILIYNEMRNDE